MQRASSALLIALGVLLLAAPATAEAPSFIPLQGSLADADGQPLDGAVTVTFGIYDTPQGGTPLWSETQEVIVDEGLFTVYLGFDSPLDFLLFANQGNLWLGVQVAQDPEMKRLFLGTVPYAAYAQHCGTVPEHAHDAAQLTNVAKAGQLCPAGQMATGFDANGNILCSQSGGSSAYALAGQYCPAGNVISGVDSNGYPVCVPGTYSGADFAISNQQCYSNEVVTGISPSGALVCDDVSGAGGLEGSGSTNKLAKFKNSGELTSSIIHESSGKIGINTSSPSQTLEVKGNLEVSGEFHWGGNKFSSSSCLVVGGSSCSSACGSHGMSCYKAMSIDNPGASTSCGQSGFKFCCCKD